MGRVPVLVIVGESVGVSVSEGVRVRVGVRVGLALRVRVGVRVLVSTSVGLEVWDAVRVLVGVCVSVGVIGSVGDSVDVSVAAPCCGGAFTGEAYTLFPTIKPNIPPARRTIIRTLKGNFLPRNMARMIASG